MQTYSEDSIVEVYPFSRQQDGDEVVIGRQETGVFLALPTEAVDVLDQLAMGKTLREVQEDYLAAYGETLDLGDFLEILRNKGIIKSPDESDPNNPRLPRHSKKSSPEAQITYHFATFPQTLAQAIFGRTSLLCVAAITLLAIALICLEPALISHPTDLYFPVHRTVSVVLLTVASYLALFLHELAHLVAARSVGVNSRMGIGHRLWVLVAETDLTGLWSVPKDQRYLPLLAGLVVDFASSALLIIGLFLDSRHIFALTPFWFRLARAMVFTYYMRIAWQCLLFIRTDLYYVIANYLGCRNLMHDTEVFLRNQLARIFPVFRMTDQSHVPLSELRVVHIFALLWMGGRAAALYLLFAVTIPVCAKYVRNFAMTFREGFSTHPGDCVDALLMFAYILLPILIGMTLWLHSLTRRESATA